jgi:hypothetical protein
MEIIGLEPWKLVWEVLEKAFLRAMNDIKNRNKKAEIVEYIKRYLKLKGKA